MAKRRPAGDGMVRKREDGRWEGRIVIGHRENGEPLFRHVYAKTQKALLDKLPAWMVIIIIAREFIISGFRLVASDNGIVIAASWWGKSKTISQMIMIILLIADIPALSVLNTVLIWVALILTVVSLIDYLVKNKNVLSMQN